MFRSSALLAVLVSAPAAFAQVRAGGEFQINTYTTALQTGGPSAVASSGDFVIAWEDRVDGSLYGIAARRYDARGVPIGAELVVNTTTIDYQAAPDVVMDARGNFVVVWWSYVPNWNIFGQRYDAAGARRGGEFRIDSYPSATNNSPAAAMDPAGNFVVVWGSSPQDGSGYGVFGQRFDAAGNRAGGEFRVNTYTTGPQARGTVAMNAAGQFVVAWSSPQDGDAEGVFAQRFTSAGDRLGGEFQVNTYTPGEQNVPRVGVAGDGSFVVIWHSLAPGPEGAEVRGRRYDPSGNAQGGEFAVNAYTTGDQRDPELAMDTRGNFVVTWGDDARDASSYASVARRFRADASPRGSEFQVNTYTTGVQFLPRASSDAVGNFTVTWSSYGQDGSSWGGFGQRYGGLVPFGLGVDTGGNSVLEPGETVDVGPAWRNVNGATQTFSAALSNITGPAGAAYAIVDGAGDYGAVADGTVGVCTDCYGVSVSNPPTRPATHWDASVVESITPDAQGQQKIWSLHIGHSFTDVAESSPFYRFIETLLHDAVTGGCGPATYCPASSTTREQMAVFLLVANDGAGYVPPACATPVFNDVPASSAFCRWIEELARRGVVGGCGGGRYCPAAAVTREQMAVLVLRTHEPALNPPPCGATPVFDDVPASSPFCRWIEELERRGVVTGCTGQSYCPTAAVTREQMAVFIGSVFGLVLYGR